MAHSVGFADTLKQFMARDGRTAGQLSQQMAALFGPYHKLPRETLYRWVNGFVKRPRNWRDVIRLAIVLRLTSGEVNQLLVAAGHGSLYELRQQILTEAEAALFSQWQDSPVPVSGMPASPFQVPPDLPYFTGRAEEISALKKIAQSDQTQQIYCLEGMGGIGKTALAIHLAYQLQPLFPDGILWADLNHSDTMTVLNLFAQAYGYDVGQYADPASRSSQVRALLARKRALIVLDDVQNDAQLRPLLPPGGTCAVIITTRRSDLAAADSAYRLQLKPFDAQGEESLALLRHILGAAYVQRERQALSEIAAQVGHLPLAIAIVGHRLKHEPGWSVTWFWQRLRQEQRRLRELKRGDQNVRLSFDVSYEALPSALQRFFVALGVFVGEDFTVEAAASVADVSPLEADDNLRQLYNLSLVQTGRPGRYHLHPLLRDYSREQIGGADYALRMAAFYLDYVDAHSREYAALDLEINHIFAALQVAFESRLKAALIKGATAFYPYLRARGLYEQARERLERAEQAAREEGDWIGLTDVLRQLADIANKQGRYEKAETLYIEGLGLARQTETDAQISALLTSLGALAQRRGEFRRAKERYEEAMILAEQSKDAQRRAALLINMGLLAANQGRVEDAEIYYLDGLHLARQIGSRWRILPALQNLGSLMEDQGRYSEAKRYFHEGLALARDSGNPELMSRLLGNLGLVENALNEQASAASHFKEGLQLAQKIGHHQLMGRQYTNLGLLATAQEQYAQAEAYYKEALAKARESGFPEDICVALNQSGACLLVQGKTAAATAAFTEAAETAEEANLQHYLGESLYGMARIAGILDATDEARRLGGKSLAILAAMKHKRADEVKTWLGAVRS